VITLHVHDIPPARPNPAREFGGKHPVAIAWEGVYALNRYAIDNFARRKSAGLISGQNRYLDAFAGKPPTDLPHVSLNAAY
jgi:hypothetical protein